MLGNSHIEVHNPHAVSLDALAETAEVIALIHHNWGVDAHVVLSKVAQLEEFSEVEAFFEEQLAFSDVFDQLQWIFLGVIEVALERRQFFEGFTQRVLQLDQL